MFRRSASLNHAGKREQENELFFQRFRETDRRSAVSHNPTGSLQLLNAPARRSIASRGLIKLVNSTRPIRRGVQKTREFEPPST
jgi:hypothetical protein